MLSDFFRINLPYGIEKNENNEWTSFNREYMPLGCNDTRSKHIHTPVYTKYKNISEKLLKTLVDEETQLAYDENGNIQRVFLYNDGTNPRNQPYNKKRLWEKYFKKIEMLSKLRIA